jgi:hypothetical protein
MATAFFRDVAEGEGGEVAQESAIVGADGGQFR